MRPRNGPIEYTEGIVTLWVVRHDREGWVAGWRSGAAEKRTRFRLRKEAIAYLDIVARRLSVRGWMEERR
jgi:hypothetical protein